MIIQLYIKLEHKCINTEGIKYNWKTIYLNENNTRCSYQCHFKQVHYCWLTIFQEGEDLYI